MLSHVHVKPSKFCPYSASCLKFRLWLNTFYEINILYLCKFQTKKAVKYLSPFSKVFIKIYYFPKFHCHIIGPSKVIIGEALAIVTEGAKTFLAKERPTFINWSAKKQEIRLIE